MVGKKINFKIANKFEIKTLLLFTFVTLFILMFSCSEDTYEDTYSDESTNVGIQSRSSYPETIPTIKPSNIKTVLKPTPRSNTAEYKPTINKTNRKVKEITFIELTKPAFINTEIAEHRLDMKIPDHWDEFENQGATKISGEQGDIVIKNYAYKDGIAHSKNAFYLVAQNIINGAKEKQYIEKSNHNIRFNDTESLISTGNYGRAYRQYLFIASSETHLTMFVFTCNPDYLSEYEDIFKEVKNSIQITNVRNKAIPYKVYDNQSSDIKQIIKTPTIASPAVTVINTPTVVAIPTVVPESAGFMGYENGITWGSTTVYNGIGYFYVDDLKQYYTNANDQIGYFYSGYAEPEAFYGNIKRNPSLCGDHDGYAGFSFNNEPTLASLVENYNNSDIKYEDLNVTFGTARSECYSGLLPFTQGGRYGLIDPVSMEGNGDLLLNWWIADRGVKEFFAAPSMRGGANLTTNWEGTKKLHVLATENTADGTGFGGVYNYVSNFNGRPMWVNLECDYGDGKCYIFYYKDPNGAVDKYGTLIDRGTWVIQGGEPSGEWSSASYTDAEWPWQGGWREPVAFVSELESK